MNKRLVGFTTDRSYISFFFKVFWYISKKNRITGMLTCLKIHWYAQKEGTCKGKKFNAICHFFGYQARGSLPSKFDCDYAYVCFYQHSLLLLNFSVIKDHQLSLLIPFMSMTMNWIKFMQVLGHICYHILAAGLNGYMATVTNLKNPVNKWRCGAAPITVGSAHIISKCLIVHLSNPMVVIISYWKYQFIRNIICYCNWLSIWQE